MCLGMVRSSMKRRLVFFKLSLAPIALPCFWNGVYVLRCNCWWRQNNGSDVVHVYPVRGWHGRVECEKNFVAML